MQQGQHHVVSPAEAQVFRLGQQAYIRKALRHARRQAIATMVVHHENFGPGTAVLQALERFQGLLPGTVEHHAGGNAGKSFTGSTLLDCIHDISYCTLRQAICPEKYGIFP